MILAGACLVIGAAAWNFLPSDSSSADPTATLRIEPTSKRTATRVVPVAYGAEQQEEDVAPTEPVLSPLDQTK
ncbi:MAG: hypothetical protein N2C14_14895, partial [Planctomycetales bacterium]